MFSVTYTGMNFRPLCTASVWPTNSGSTVERRDHVLTTFFCRDAFSASTFSTRWASTNGPFAVDRPTAASLLLPPGHDVPVGRLAPPRLGALGRLAPRCHRVVALPATLAPAHRMVDRVHGDAAHRRPDAHPPGTPGLPDRDVLVVEVADLADGGEAVHVDQPDLAGGQLDVGHLAFLGDQLSPGARAPAELPALARLELHVV